MRKWRKIRGACLWTSLSSRLIKEIRGAVLLHKKNRWVLLRALVLTFGTFKKFKPKLINKRIIANNPKPYYNRRSKHPNSKYSY